MKKYRFKVFTALTIILCCITLSFYDIIYNEIYFYNKSLVFDSNKNKLIPSGIKVKIDYESYEKILNKRTEALNKGYLIKKKDDYVFGHLIIDNKKIKAKVRLKGDHIDHLSTNMWSYRIKLKDTTILGYSKFSIQPPKTRGYMCEWIFHQLLKHENIVNLDYFFIPFSLNNNHKGIYAFEGHFNSSILLNSNRPNGPILKFNEDKLWQTISEEKKINDTLLYREANINIYNKSWGQDCKNINNRAKKLLSDYQAKKIEADSVFDLNLWAKYIVIGKTLGSAHQLRWHNLRFYYNIKTMKIEPIGFDMSSWFNKDHWPYEGSFEPFYDLLYENTKFKSLISFHFNRINNEEYFRNFLKTIESEMKMATKLIGVSNPNDSIISFIRKNNEL